METTQNQSQDGKRTFDHHRDCLVSLSYDGGKQAEGEIFSFVPDASELTGAGATATEVGENVLGSAASPECVLILCQLNKVKDRTDAWHVVGTCKKSQNVAWPRTCAGAALLSSLRCAR